MRFWHKLVSVGVLAVVVLLPFLSMAMCVPEAGRSMHCPPGCPMAKMMKSRHHRTGTAVEDTAPCCKVQKPNPLPPAETKSSPIVVSHSSYKPVAVVMSIDEGVGIIRAVADDSPPPQPDSQARLCTFQI